MFDAIIQVHFRLDFYMEANNMTMIRLGSSLLWVQIVCNIGFQST